MPGQALSAAVNANEDVNKAARDLEIGTVTGIGQTVAWEYRSSDINQLLDQQSYDQQWQQNIATAGAVLSEPGEAVRTVAWATVAPVVCSFAAGHPAYSAVYGIVTVLTFYKSLDSFAALTRLRPLGTVQLASRAVDDLVAIQQAAAQAHLAQSISRRPRAAGALTVRFWVGLRRKTFVAQSVRGSNPPSLNGKVQAFLDTIPEDQQSDLHGRCVEPQCLSQALDARLMFQREGGTSVTVKVRAPSNPQHGVPLPACLARKALLEHFGMRDGASQ